MLPCEGSEDPVSEVLETFLWRDKQNHISIAIPTNATAPAAPPNIAARVLDIWCGNPFTYAVQIYMNYYYTLNLESRE